MAKKGRVFSGARPTGRQHLGNFLGAIKNYVALQDDYECVYCIVDLHALTTLDEFEDLRQNTSEMALDWLAAGMPPASAGLLHLTRASVRARGGAHLKLPQERAGAGGAADEEHRVPEGVGHGWRAEDEQEPEQPH